MPSNERVMPDHETTDVVGDRIGAQVVDLVIMFVQAVLVGLVLAFLFSTGTEAGLRSNVFFGFLSLPLYGGLLEGYWGGQTVGKRIAGIKVVDSIGREPGVGQALLRNLPAVVLFSWVTSAVALASMAVTSERQRVFDLFADTYVVRAPG